MTNQKITSFQKLENAHLHLWEDVSESYCLLKIAATSRKKVVLLFDHAATEAELSYAKRYIASFGPVSLEIFGIYFNQAMEIVPTDNYAKILKALAGNNFILLKYQARKSRVLSGNQFKKAEFLDRLAVSLYLPNYRERCEMTYLFYSSDSKYLSFIESVLGDDYSGVVLNELMRVAAENDIWKIAENESGKKYFECYRHKDDEIWVNCGSCGGDTIMNFIASQYEFSKIFAVEGDPKMFTNLERTLKLLPGEQQKKIRPLNYFIGMDDSKSNFDGLFRHVPVSLINMDIEGHEMPVLRGAVEIIKAHRPVLAISAYHITTDLYDIPLFVNSVAENYTYYLRKYAGQAGNDFNEFIYYCVPEERTV